MKKRLKKYNTIKKRSAAMVTAIIMTIGCVPMNELPPIISRIRTLLPSVKTAHAEDEVVFYDKADFTNTYVKDGVDTGYIYIQSWSDWIWYSQAYYNYSHGKYNTIQHEKDTIYCAISDQAANTYDLKNKNYVPIGNDTKPFEGKIIFHSGSPDTFNVPDSLFGTVSEKMKILSMDGITSKTINISKTVIGNHDALFANKVVSDNNPQTSSDWNILFQNYGSSTAAITYGGIIGEIEDGANVGLTVTNNASPGLSNIEASASSEDSGNAPIDAGALCGALGDGATLTATYSGSNSGYTITSANGNAGGLVGTMGSGSVLTVTASNLQESAGVYAENGYAGGLVGYNNGGKVKITPPQGSSTYSIGQFIHGKNGAGGLFGYYAVPSNVTELDISKYSIDCTVNLLSPDTGYAGGLIGEFENKIGAFTIKGTASTGTTVASTHDSSTDSHGIVTGASAKAYGGLVGSYKADQLSRELILKDLKATPDNELSAPVYGGGIGTIKDASYVKYDNFTLISADGTRINADETGFVSFGGLAAEAESAYVYADTVTIGTSLIDGFTGGGLIGKLGDGVLGIKGTINLNNAKPTAADVNGQIVGTRDNALIYFDETWTYTPNAAEIDNVGSWGDVLVIDGTKLKKDAVSDNLNVFSESNHIITIDSVTTSSIANAADYAKVSLLYQIDVTKNDFIADTPSSLTSSTSNKLNLTFTNDIDLTGTSLRGITRDNGTTNIDYSGTVTGNNKTVILDIKNVGGSNRPVYRHSYNGLFANAKNATFNGLYLAGSIKVKSLKDTVYAGALAATASGTLTASGCKTLDGLSMDVRGSKAYVAGRFVGSASSMGDINVSGSEFGGTITGTSGCIGGVFGKIATKSAATWTFDSISLKGSVTGVKTVGGLAAEVSGDGKATINLGDSNSIVIDGMTVTGNDTDSSGGLLGYGWYSTDVNVNKVSVSNTPTVASSSGGTAGLVYVATGHWTITSLDLREIKMNTSSAKSVGMIVNKGTSGSDGIYLELPSGYDYKLSFASGSNVSASVTAHKFDELCAFSATNGKVMENGQGIVSISTPGLVMEKSNATYTDSLSYKNQTVQGKYKNENTRYYYNLDTIDKDNNLSDLNDQKKLMRWGLNQYAASNLSSFFPDPFNGTIPTGTYDMKSYSWYPVTPLMAMTVNGTFEFYNEEFDECEKVKAKLSSISNDEDKNIWSPLLADQHYMMQNGLFYNVNKNLTIGNITLAGTIGALDDTSGTGALIYGNVKGDSKNTTVISNTGKISLAGIRVWNLSTYPSYAPLLINKASDYVTFNISNVYNTAAYKYTVEESGASVVKTVDAATSLIGKAGTRDTVNGDTPISQGITVNFSDIKLDGRKNESVSAYGTTPDRYNTTKSIFTKATLLEQLIGSNGIYNYTFDEDWGTGTPHNVTYGKEVGYTTEGQYPNQELWYKDEKVSGGKSRYIHPDAAPADSGSTQYTGFNSFRPYVASVNTKAEIDAKTGFKYQLMVNHQPSDKISGCGTYNDPYIITNATDLVNISKFINSSSLLNGKINIDIDKNGWCDSTTVGETITLYTGHVEYTLDGTSDATCTGQNSMEADEIRKYLASAYYQIRLSGATQLELSASSGFLGLGTADIPFSGVIDGGQSASTTIKNQTQYPLINYSGGCVVRNLNVTVDATVTLDDATDSYDYISGGKTHGAYGAIIAVVEGGDNVIDNTQITFGSSVIKAKGKKAQFQPIGGYVGVVVNGGVIFRNMNASGNIGGLASSNVSAVNGAEYPQINDSKGKQITASNLSTYTANMIDSDNLLWLYVNPIIGRVINGYAVNIASAYHPAYSDCIMNNGNKSYSITDISLSGGSLTISAPDITVPNGQAFFLMSIIVNSGMGANATKLGYTTAYTKRTAAYNAIGSNAAASSSCGDYYTYAKNDTTSGTAYIIKNFATGGSTLGSGGPWNITLTASGSFVLPDGFRGIGNFYQNDNSLLLNVSDFNGNGVTITENILFYTYDDGSENFDNKYYPNDGVEGETTFCSTTDAGIGLFTKQPQAGSNYYNFKLSGKIKSDVINHKTGVHVDYTGNTNPDKVGGGNSDQKQVLSAGMLFGNFSGAGAKRVRNSTPTYITNVALVNVDVSAAKMAGGMIGIVPIGGSSSNKDDRYANLEIKITDSTYNSSGIKVHGGLSAAGLIARYQQGTCNIDFNGNRFDIIEIVSDTKSDTNSYHYGVGGIVGTLRADRNSPATPVTIRNITLGDINATKAIEVKCSESGKGINAGGLIGSLNRASATMENCHVYNVSVSSNGTSTHVGGAFGHMRTECNVTVKESSIESNDTVKASIIGNGYVGGFLGNSPNSKDKALNFIVEKSCIKGYTISGAISGGIVGERDAKNTANYLKVSDFSIENCIIKGDTYAGGLVGHLSNPLNGYNILAKDVTFEPHTDGGSIANLGYLVAKNDSVVKLVGFSRQTDSSSTMVHAMTGGDNANNYGMGGYVIFADRMGTASYNDDGTPRANSSNAFSSMTSSTSVVLNAPYVNASPKTNIANFNGTMQFVLGDGASPLTSAEFGKSTQALAKIYDDIVNANNGRYDLAKDYIDTSDEYKAFTSKISSFKTEMGTSKNLASGIDFPVLVLDNVDPAQMTAFINQYIRLLTNTPDSFNYADDVSNVYSVVLKKVTFNAAGNAIETISSDNVCLNKAGHQFYMEADDTDTKAANAQFTLIDVQFYDPSSSSSVAYHLYIPCYVRKLLEYDFDIHLDSGTNYDISSNIPAANALVENIGTPVTFEFAYTYNRTAEEWSLAVNSGDSLLNNYPKSLLFDNSTEVSSGNTKPNFPSGTKMVLIDTQNSSKAYYLDTVSFSGNQTSLNLSTFSSIEGSSFTPLDFNDLLTVSVVKASDGHLVVENNASQATVKDTTTGQTYKHVSSGGTHKAIVSLKNGASSLSEHYFLTVYTPYNTNDVVYHYTVQSNKSLGTDPYPSRITVGSENKAANLIIGNIYQNHIYIDSLKVGGVENAVIISAEKNSIEAELHADIGFTSSGEYNAKGYFSGDNPPDIYQSFLIKLQKGSEWRINAVSSVYVDANDYWIGGRKVDTINNNPDWNNKDYTEVEPNYIELRNGVPLASKLANIASNSSLRISVKATINFDINNLSDQFYPESDERRTTLHAYSNIASNSAQTASSKVSDGTNLVRSDASSPGTTPGYFIQNNESAKLNYEALDIPQEGQLPQLGINANDPADTKHFPMLIQTVASYDVEKCPSAYNSANYIKCEIELRSKNDNYRTDLEVFKYIDEETFEILGQTNPDRAIDSTTKLVYIFAKDSISSYYDAENKVYQIPINFKVYSGMGTDNKFESEKLQYSNYEIVVTVSMLTDEDSETPIPESEHDTTNNYVKYTNARIYLKKINRAKTSA